MNDPLRQVINCGAPALLALHRADPGRYPVLLASALSAGELGRYDILFCQPQAALYKFRDGSIATSGVSLDRSRGFLQALDQWWRAGKLAADKAQAPFSGGWFVFLGYEIAAEIEATLNLPESPDSVVAAALRVSVAVIRDRRSERIDIVWEPGFRDLARVVAGDIERLAPLSRSAVIVEASQEEDPARHLHAVAEAQEHIAAGDIYQANLSREWRARLAASAQSTDLFEQLCAANPAGFAGIAALGDLTIVSSSPERLIAIRDGVVSTRPIAGTRPRAVDRRTDAVDGAALIGHPKERAEHVMLIDL
ncbi:MAG: chorismate-binding protein, partial [Steroidobacteraceae bacterium]